MAKHAYVATHSGWFSERSACYLAAGRPVLGHDTGFSEFLDTGEGLLSFADPEEAISGLEEIARRYDFHCRRAREIAEANFDSAKVLSELLESVLNDPG